MGNKMKFPFLFKSRYSTTTTSSAVAAASPSPWPACVNNHKTLSFRAEANANIYSTINSAYLDEYETGAKIAESSDSFFSIDCGGEEISTSSPETAAMRGLRSDRFFFEPGETSSILEEAKPHAVPFGAKITAVDSDDPVLDFRNSMAEMVEAHGLKSWERLEELLSCYLLVNGKSNRRYIVEAFVELLVQICPDISAPASATDEHCSSSSTTTTQNSFTSPLSFSSSSAYSSTDPSFSLMENEDEIAATKNAAGR